MGIDTLLRKAEHAALSRLTLSGTILDLGGDTRATYLQHIGGTHTVTCVNLDQNTAPDLYHDLEKPLPLADAAFDHVLLINVLEHIYHAHQLLAEAARVVRPGGSVVIVVPYLFPYHPSPRDYWRFSQEALTRMCQDVQLEIVSLTPLGSGVFASRFLMLDRLLPLPLRALGFLLHPIVALLDGVFAALARLCGKKYRASDYALGFCVSARRAP